MTINLEQQNLSKLMANAIKKHASELEAFKNAKSNVPQLSIEGLDNEITQNATEVLKKLKTKKIFLNKCIIKANVVLDFKNSIDILTNKAELLVICTDEYILTYNKYYAAASLLHRPTQKIVRFGKRCDEIPFIYSTALALQTIVIYNELANADKEYLTTRKRRVTNKKGKTTSVTDYSISVTDYKRYIYDSQDDSPKRKYERHTEHWGVRGHWRTYKSGKRVWIKPGTRGDKSKPLNKQTYTV